jgi:teichuronic acid biosynthesis glycosyltransferase TuaC
MHVLTITPFFPSATNDSGGCFISEPLGRTQQFDIKNSIFAVQPVHHGRAHSSKDAPPAEWISYPAWPGGPGLPSAGALLYTTLVSRIRKLHRSQPVDLVHAHGALPCGHAAALLERELGIPYVVTVHGLDAFFTNQVRGLAGNWCKRVSRRVYCSARQVVCISERVCDEAVKGASAILRTAVIYNGADPQLFLPSPGGGSPATILSVGNLIPSKGHELLLRAISAIHPWWPDLCWEIIGEGPEYSRLCGIADYLGVARNIRFLGQQSRRQVAAAMQRCTLFALPSHYEGLGCVYLEAMCAEKPVIACRGQGIQEVIQHGINGWLVDAGDLSGLTEALSRLLENAPLRAEIGTAARRTILRDFTVDHQAERLAKLYGECAA